MSKNCILLDSQKRTVIEILQETGLSASDFGWRVEIATLSYVDCEVSELVRKGTNFYFLFAHDSDGWQHTRFSPGKNILTFSNNYSGWDTLWKYVQQWAGYLARELEAQDFVRIAMQTKPLNELAIALADNKSFTPEEQQLIDDKLDRIETHILKTRDFQEKEAEHVRQQIRLLKDELKRIGHSAWLYMCFGVLTTITVTYLDVDNARMLFAFANEQLGSIFTTFRQIGSE